MAIKKFEVRVPHADEFIRPYFHLQNSTKVTKLNHL